MSKPNIACKHGWSVSQRSAQCPHCGKERRESSESVSNIQSLDEILEQFDEGIASFIAAGERDIALTAYQEAKAALERREGRIKLQAEANTYRRAAKVVYGMETAQMAIDELEENAYELEQQLKALDGEENTNE